MARRETANQKSCASCLAIPVVIGLFLYAGPVVSMIIGALVAVAGFKEMGDRRKSPITGFGLLGIGAILFVIGLVWKMMG